MKTKRKFKSFQIILGLASLILFGIQPMVASEAESRNPQMSIVEIASADERFSILVEAVAKADLVGALSADGPYTVFAPTNDAFMELFEALDVSGINDLTKDQLTPILLYHVVNGKVMAADVTTGIVPTLNSDASMDIKVSGNKVKIDKKSTVIITDVEASNGVIHVIDSVLIPSADDQASASGSSCEK